jgi:hypothetical protein
LAAWQEVAALCLRRGRPAEAAAALRVATAGCVANPGAGAGAGGVLTARALCALGDASAAAGDAPAAMRAFVLARAALAAQLGAQHKLTRRAAARADALRAAKRRGAASQRLPPAAGRAPPASGGGLALAQELYTAGKVCAGSPRGNNKPAGADEDADFVKWLES